MKKFFLLLLATATAALAQLNIPWADVSGKPTTLAGYQIPDAPVGDVLPNFITHIKTYRGDLGAAIDIIGLGSSVGAGAGLTAPLSSATDAPLPYFVAQLGAYVNRLGIYNLVGTNYSANGTTVFDGMTTAYPAAVAASKPGRIVLICFGMNDGGTANFNAGETYSGMYGYLQTLIANIRAQGADPVLVTTPHPHTTRSTYSMPPGVAMSYPTAVAANVPDASLWPTVANSAPTIIWQGVSIPVSARHFLVNQAFRAVARENGVGMIDAERYWFDAVAARGQDALFDPAEIVHPNNLGYQLSYHAAIKDWVRAIFDSRTFAGGAVSSGAIGAGTVTNANLANVATATIKGRATGGTGPVEDLTVALLKTLLSYPSSSTDNTILRADGTSGGIQGSGVTIDDSNNMAGLNNVTSPTVTLQGGGYFSNTASLVYNTAGPVTLTIPDNSGGTVVLVAAQGGIGKSAWVIPYVKNGGTITLGTPSKAITSSDPVSSATARAGSISVALLAANTNVRWGINATPF